MPAELNFLSILTGCFASPVAENPTVAMVEAAYRHHGSTAGTSTARCRPRDLGDAVRGAPGDGLDGLQLHDPAQGRRDPRTSTGSAESATIIGAVNCVVRPRRRAASARTPTARGSSSRCRRSIDPAGQARRDPRRRRRGAGHRASSSALAGAPSITIVNRDRDARRRRWSQLINEQTPARGRARPWEGDVSTCPTETDLVVNATSIGLFPDVDARLRARPRHAPARA